MCTCCWSTARRIFASPKGASTSAAEAAGVRPNPATAPWVCQGDYSWLVNQYAYYCSELERERKYALYIWPIHCLLGSDGHPLVGVIHEARLFQGFVADFTPEAEAAFERFQRAGMHVVRSTDPLESWPDLTL